MRTVDELNQADAEEFVSALAPLFEGGAGFLRRLADARPFETEEHLFDVARAVAREMPEDEQVALLNAHPRIGADPAAMSKLSSAEQGYDRATADDQAWVGEELLALNEAYEGRFGFRFVVFVAGRTRAELLPVLRARLGRTRGQELETGVRELVAIARDRARAPGAGG